MDIAAPGSEIYSTAIPSEGYYATYSGTSMATPYIAGAAALVWSAMPHLSDMWELQEAMMATVSPKPSLANAVYSGGELDVAALLEQSLWLLLGDRNAQVEQVEDFGPELSVSSPRPTRPETSSCEWAGRWLSGRGSTPASCPY